jgi:hypothetical protein
MGTGLTLSRFLLAAGQQLLALGGVTQDQGGRCGNGPFAVRLADVCAGGPQAFAARCLAILHPAARGGEGLHAGNAHDAGHAIAPHAAEKLAKAGQGVEPGVGLGMVERGSFEAREGEGFPPLLIIGDEGEVDLDGLWHRRSVKPRSIASQRCMNTETSWRREGYVLFHRRRAPTLSPPPRHRKPPPSRSPVREAREATHRALLAPRAAQSQAPAPRSETASNVCLAVAMGLQTSCLGTVATLWHPRSSAAETGTSGDLYKRWDSEHCCRSEMIL